MKTKREKEIIRLIGKGSKKTNAERNRENDLLEAQFKKDFPEKVKYLKKRKFYKV